MVKEADFYQKLGETVQCTLCPHNCRLAADEWGVCGVRQNRRGALVTHVYEAAVAAQVDPIEKKPLFHVFPGSQSFSIATVGCNFRCSFCQNHRISQVKGGFARQPSLPAARVVQLAMEHDCRTIACTYTEPTVYFEYAYDIARLAAEQGIRTVFVTNGYINPGPLRKIAPLLAAANVDLKGWSETFYREVCGGELKPVLTALRLMKQLGIWVEVTTLAVTGFADDDATLRSIARFIVNELGSETPWHISRFHPDFQYADARPTAPEVLLRARQIGVDEGLRYVYCGNLPGEGENTFCHACSRPLIERYGYRILGNVIRNGKCPKCGADVAGIGM